MLTSLFNAARNGNEPTLLEQAAATQPTTVRSTEADPAIAQPTEPDSQTLNTYAETLVAYYKDQPEVAIEATLQVLTDLSIDYGAGQEGWTVRGMIGLAFWQRDPEPLKRLEDTQRIIAALQRSNHPDRAIATLEALLALLHRSRSKDKVKAAWTVPFLDLKTGSLNNLLLTALLVRAGITAPNSELLAKYGQAFYATLEAKNTIAPTNQNSAHSTSSDEDGPTEQGLDPKEVPLGTPGLRSSEGSGITPASSPRSTPRQSWWN